MARSLRRRLLLFLALPLIALKCADAAYDYYSLERTARPADTAAEAPPAAARGGVARLPWWRRLLWDFFELDISLFLIWLGIHFGLRPLDQLKEEIDARAGGELHSFDADSAPTELRPLLRALNRLLAILEEAAQAQDRFVANAAHQLRTPIAGLAAQLDLVIAETGDAATRQRLVHLDAGLRQLARSANQLLALSRAEAGVGESHRARRVDLREILTDLAGRAVDRALRLGVDLSVDAQSALVRADPSLLEEAIANLIDNALNYTPTGGEVVLGCGIVDGEACVAVTDNGPGIPPGERRRVLDRFYRMPGSPGHGTGLGLAIVNEIARRYGGAVSIEDPPGGRGTRMRISLPTEL